MILKTLFWIIVFLILHTYFLYPFVLWLISYFSKNKKNISADNFYPKISIVIDTYNNEKVISSKIKNSLDLDYPRDRLEVFIVDGGSTDRTPEIISTYKDEVKFLRIFEKKGKINALNTVVPLTTGNILLFSTPDVYERKDVLLKIASHFSDLKVGCVTGYVRSASKIGSFVSHEGLYTGYEQFIESSESKINTATLVNDDLYAIRRQLYHNIKEGDLEELAVPINVINDNYSVVFDKDVYGWNYRNPSFREEIRRKSRIVSSGFRYLPRFIFKDPLTSFQFMSHRILRWIVPELLAALLVINWFLLSDPLYQNLFVTQIIFYIFSPLCVLLSSFNMFSIPYYFFVMNLSALFGFFRFIVRRN